MEPVRPNCALGIFLDTETTGLKANRHHIIEIALKIVRLDNFHVLGEYQSVVKVSAENWLLAEKDALDVNGFTWERIEREGRDIEIIAKEILQLFKKHHINFGNSFYYAYNASFDKDFFNQIIPSEVQWNSRLPFHWNDVKQTAIDHHLEQCEIGLVDGKLPSFSKDNVANRLGLPPEEKPHRAMNGVDHMLLIYKTIKKK